MTLDPDDRVTAAKVMALYGAPAQASMDELMKETGMETPDGINMELPDSSERPYEWTDGKRRPVHEIMDDIITYRQDRDRVISKLDRLTFELIGANGPME